MIEERRKHEEENSLILREIHTSVSQIPIFVEEITKLKKTVYGNGEKGLCEKVRLLDVKLEFIPKLIGWAIAIVSITFGAYEYLKK